MNTSSSPAVGETRSAAKQQTAEFSGKHVLVTGGTQGIGEPIVHRLVRGGATVITGGEYVIDGGTIPTV